MKVLVTGGRGLIGSNLQKYANKTERGITWVFSHRGETDLTDYNQVVDLFNRHQPTHVINLAAYVGGLYKNMREPVEFFTNNMLINMNVMKCCHEMKVEKLISVMSTCIFPDSVTYPLTEDQLHNGPPHTSNEGYSYAKRMIDVLSRAYNAEYNTKFITVIPGNIYGKWDNFNLENSHVVPALIHKCFLSENIGGTLTIAGSGNPLRQFTYAKDIAKLLVIILMFYDKMDPIILSTTEEVSIRDVAELIAREFGQNEILFDTSKSDGQFKKTCSNSRLKLQFPYFKFTPLEKGVRKAVKWFKNNYSTARV